MFVFLILDLNVVKDEIFLISFGSLDHIAKVGGKCVISHFPGECVLVNATHPSVLTKKVKLLS